MRSPDRAPAAGASVLRSGVALYDRSGVAAKHGTGRVGGARGGEPGASLPAVDLPAGSDGPFAGGLPEAVLPRLGQTTRGESCRCPAIVACGSGGDRSQAGADLLRQQPTARKQIQASSEQAM